ncbi:MAG: 4Fe-4S dicluster domain-containing protein [Melioribacteraceae bacterium]|nr:4Fe-4S dicluster domain-containing protein [Melioribacteraceae bacterium]
MDRRNFMKAVGLMGLATMPGKKTKAGQSVSDKEFNAILIDTTLCEGCEACLDACSESNKLPEAVTDPVAGIENKTSPNQLAVVNMYNVEDLEVTVKKQCMHCNQPACASACLTNAMFKTEEGPVIWRADKCMGCRFCMLSCPYDIPKFEYEKVNPDIKKCNMCYDRIKDGDIPACAEACPAEAIVYGTRKDMLEEARRRIYQNPDDYVHHIFGEDEVGGASVLYLSAVPFEKLGFKTKLGNEAMPKLTTDFLYSVPVIETLLPPFLLAISFAAKKSKEAGEGK